MDLEAFKKSAELIVSRNVSEHVQAVFADFKNETGSLNLIYCTNGTPTEDDEEDCEVACAELLAHYPDIRLAETQCVAVSDKPLLTGMTRIFFRE